MPPRELNPTITAKMLHILTPAQEIRHAPARQEQTNERSNQMREPADLVLAAREDAVTAGGTVDGRGVPRECTKGQGCGEAFGVQTVVALGGGC